MHSWERLQAEGGGLTAFYLRRAFRVYPLSILAVLTMVGLEIPPTMWAEYAWPGWAALGSNLLLTQNLTFDAPVLAPLWSLPLEIQMYAVLPALYWLVRKHREGTWAELTALVVAGAALGLVQPQVSARLSVLPYAPCFLGGVIAYVLSRRGEARLPAWVWPSAIAMAMAAYGPFDNRPMEEKIWLGWAACLGLGVLLARVRPVSEERLNRVTAWMAKYSYALYIAHVPVYWLVFRVCASWPLGVKLTVAAGLLASVSTALYHLVEAPMIAVGVRVTAQRVSAVKAMAATA